MVSIYVISTNFVDIDFRQLYKNPYQHSRILFINFPFLNFGTEGSWYESLGKGLKIEISFKI